MTVALLVCAGWTVAALLVVCMCVVAGRSDAVTATAWRAHLRAHARATGTRHAVVATHAMVRRRSVNRMHAVVAQVRASAAPSPWRGHRAVPHVSGSTRVRRHARPS